MEPAFVTYADKSKYLNFKNWTNMRLHDTIKKDIKKWKVTPLKYINHST